MKIINHRLIGDNTLACSFSPSPNYSKGRMLEPEYIVIHYTAGNSAQGSINWLCNPQAKASAHIVISRDGEITQLVNFNKVAWHAGVSSWDDKVSLNQYSIGIELDNAGKLQRIGDRWRSWTGKPVDNQEVVIAAHKNESEECAWQSYTPEQIEACRDLCTTLMRKYPIKEILGHEDIAPMRKTDPGPAFPMPHLQSIVEGRATEKETLPIRRTTTYLNIRTGPGTGYAKLEEGPLPEGFEVLVLAKKNNWNYVEALDILNGNADIQGWVYGKYLS